MIKAQEEMAKDRDAMRKDVNFVKDRVDELVDVSAERDKNHVDKLDTIMDSVVSKFKKTEEFPIVTDVQLAALTDRILHGTEKFETDYSLAGRKPRTKLSDQPLLAMMAGKLI